MLLHGLPAPKGGDPRDHAASEWKDPIEVSLASPCASLRAIRQVEDTRLDRDRRDRAADAEPAEPTELGSPASLKRCARPLHIAPPRPRALRCAARSSCRQVIAPGNGCSPIKEAWESQSSGLRVNVFVHWRNHESRKQRNWYFWLAKSLNGRKLLQEEAPPGPSAPPPILPSFQKILCAAFCEKLQVLLRDFPDPFEAKREIWLKFMKEESAGVRVCGCAGKVTSAFADRLHPAGAFGGT